MKVVIDTREKNVIEKFKEYVERRKLNILIDVQKLDVGDFYVENGSYTYLVERKTLSDFNNSVINGRIWGQLHRLESEIENHDRVILAITNFYFTKYIKPTIVYSALGSICQRYSIDILFFKNNTQFFNFITKLSRPPKSKPKMKVEYILQPLVGDLTGVTKVNVTVYTTQNKKKKHIEFNVTPKISVWFKKTKRKGGLDGYRPNHNESGQGECEPPSNSRDST